MLGVKYVCAMKKMMMIKKKKIRKKIVINSKRKKFRTRKKLEGEKIKK